MQRRKLATTDSHRRRWAAALAVALVASALLPASRLPAPRPPLLHSTLGQLTDRAWAASLVELERPSLSADAVEPSLLLLPRQLPRQRPPRKAVEPPVPSVEPPAASPLPDEYLRPPQASEIPGLHVALAAAPPAPPPRAAPREIAPRIDDPYVAGRVLRRGVYERDKLHGVDLPGSAAVASALGATVRSRTPVVSLGVFRAVIGADGRLAEIVLVDFMGGTADGWQRAAEEAAIRLASRHFTLRSPFERGAVVTVRIEQCAALPSGRGCVRWRAPPFEMDEWPYYAKPEPRTTSRTRPTAVPIDSNFSQIRVPNLNDLTQLAGIPTPSEPRLQVDERLPGPNRRRETVRGFDASDIGATASRRVSIFFSTNALEPTHRF